MNNNMIENEITLETVNDGINSCPSKIKEPMIPVDYNNLKKTTNEQERIVEAA